MNINAEKAIQALINKAESAPAEEVMKYTQAALNLAHVFATCANTERMRSE